MATCTTGGASGGLAGAHLKRSKSQHRQTSANIPTASHTEIRTLPTALSAEGFFYHRAPTTKSVTRRLQSIWQGSNTGVVRDPRDQAPYPPLTLLSTSSSPYLFS